MKTQQEIKERIIEYNYEILNNFEDKEKVRVTRDKINTLLNEYLELTQKNK